MPLLNALKLEWAKLGYGEPNSAESMARNAFLYRHYAALHQEVMGSSPWDSITEFPYCIWKSWISSPTLQRQKHVDSVPIQYKCITNLPNALEVFQALDPLFFNTDQCSFHKGGHLTFFGNVNVKIPQFNLALPNASKVAEGPRLDPFFFEQLNAATSFEGWWSAISEAWLAQACTEIHFPVDHLVAKRSKVAFHERVRQLHINDTKVHFKPVSKMRMLPPNHPGVDVEIRCIATDGSLYAPLWWHAGCYRQRFNSEPTVQIKYHFFNRERTATGTVDDVGGIGNTDPHVLCIKHWMIEYSSRGIRDRATQWYSIHRSMYDNIAMDSRVTLSQWAREVLRNDSDIERALPLPLEANDCLSLDSM